jgi:hypothetical protein
MSARSRPWTFVCDWGTDEQSGSGCSQGTFLNQALFALDITLGGQAGSKIERRIPLSPLFRVTIGTRRDIPVTHVPCQKVGSARDDRRNNALFSRNTPFLLQSLQVTCNFVLPFRRRSSRRFGADRCFRGAETLQVIGGWGVCDRAYRTCFGQSARATLRPTNPATNTPLRREHPP